MAREEVEKKLLDLIHEAWGIMKEYNPELNVCSLFADNDHESAWFFKLGEHGKDIDNYVSREVKV